MDVRYRWAWFCLAALSAATLAWTTRYQYAACDTDGCVAIHRWTGSITFRDAAWDGPPDEAQIVRARSHGTHNPGQHKDLHYVGRRVP